ncbi:WGR domain-containing protein [Sinorhizobium meliloti]|uniref:WGR domain-containing protein n=1 Tax=Rhizobium meliloti TaxID=382 RepID=UPI000FE0130F|nr:WGR domain-containing protein [Sinorhizobium meliloti]RVK88961.1 WGR domain-containing protein [Sinorhizobium meliloti]
MTQHWFRLYVQRIDTTRNMARFYAMSIEPDLFGGSALIRRWGRIGTRGQERIDLFKDDAEAAEAIGRFLFLARQKRARGYRPQAHT